MKEWVSGNDRCTYINPLKHSGYYTYHLHQLQETLHSDHTVCLYLPNNSDKLLLFSQQALNGGCL